MSATEYTIRGRQADDLVLAMRLFDDRGRERDLTGVVLRTIIKDGPTALADTSPANFATTITNAARGVIELRLRASALPAGCYYYELDDISGAATEGLLYGQLIITEGLFQ